MVTIKTWLGFEPVYTKETVEKERAVSFYSVLGISFPIFLPLFNDSKLSRAFMCFCALRIGSRFSRSWHWLPIFSRLWKRLLSFPLMVLVTDFPTPTTVKMPTFPYWASVSIFMPFNKSSCGLKILFFFRCCCCC